MGRNESASVVAALLCIGVDDVWEVNYHNGHVKAEYQQHVPAVNVGNNI